MKLRRLAAAAGIATLAITHAPCAALADDAPLPMRTEQPIVYATPISNFVILEFKLYDNRTWCRLYIAKATWEQVLANDGNLPAGADPGELQCEQR